MSKTQRHKRHLKTMIDVYLIAIHFGARVGDLDYVRNYDIEDDGIISMIDLYHAALCFGQTLP